MNDITTTVFTVEEVKLPQMLPIKEASKIVNLPEHYLRRLCKTVPNLAIMSGRKYYINMGQLKRFLEGQFNQP